MNDRPSYILGAIAGAIICCGLFGREECYGLVETFIAEILGLAKDAANLMKRLSRRAGEKTE